MQSKEGLEETGHKDSLPLADVLRATRDHNIGREGGAGGGRVCYCKHGLKISIIVEESLSWEEFRVGLWRA